MPDFYAEGEYDLSGFAVGVVKKDVVTDRKTISVGDVLIGLPSSGVHSNGFSLVRRVLARNGLSLKDVLPGNAIKSISNISKFMKLNIVEHLSYFLSGIFKFHGRLAVDFWRNF